MTDPGSDWLREVVARKRGRPVEEPESKKTANDKQEVETDQ